MTINNVQIEYQTLIMDYQDIVNYTEHLSLDELLLLKDKIKSYIKKKRIPNIREDIVANGYSCSILSPTQLEIKSDLSYLILHFYINLSSWGPYDDRDNINVCGWSKEQPAVFSRLKFNYTPTNKDPWEFDYSNEWVADEEGEMCGRGFLPVYVYYKRFPLPPNDILLDIIYDDWDKDSRRSSGDIEQIIIKQGNIYLNNTMLGAIKEWDELDIFLLPIL